MQTQSSDGARLMCAPMKDCGGAGGGSPWGRSKSSSNCCFLTCIQVSQEASKVFWYSHLFKNFPEFVVMHTVKGFNLVSKAKVDVFLEFFCYFDDPVDVGNLISGSSAFS